MDLVVFSTASEDVMKADDCPSPQTIVLDLRGSPIIESMFTLKCCCFVNCVSPSFWKLCPSLLAFKLILFNIAGSNDAQ